MSVMQRSDARFVQIVEERETVAVAVTSTVILAPTSMRGFDEMVIFVDNDGADTFNGEVEISPDGVFPGYVIRPVAYVSAPVANIGGTINVVNASPAGAKLWNGTCLNVGYLASATTATTLNLNAQLTVR